MTQPEPQAVLHGALYDAYIEIRYDPDFETHDAECRVCEDWCADGDKDGVKYAADQHITEIHVRTAMDGEPIIRRAVAEEIAANVERSYSFDHEPQPIPRGQRELIEKVAQAIADTKPCGCGGSYYGTTVECRMPAAEAVMAALIAAGWAPRAELAEEIAKALESLPVYTPAGPNQPFILRTKAAVIAREIGGRDA